MSTDEIGAMMRSRFLFSLAFALTQLTACAVSGHLLQPQQIDDIKGVYLLDNGTTLTISHVQRRLYAELGHRGLVEMVPVADNRFVAPDQRMTMEYRKSDGGEIVLTYPADVDAPSDEIRIARLAMNR
jgi:hypothetical protein